MTAPANPRSRPASRRRRIAQHRRAAALKLGRIVEVLETDMMMWDAERPLRPARPRAQVDVQRVGSGDEWRRLIPHERVKLLQRNLARGDIGFVARVGDEFAGWVWLSRVTHRDPYSGLLIRLAADEGYCYGLWIEPAHRPAGTGAVLMTTLLAHARDELGLTRVYGWVDRRNRESQMLVRMLGMVSVQRVRRLHVLRRLGRPLPGSARPRFGPLSPAGRHRE